MDALTPCPPWLLNDAERLLSAINSKRVHHALLVTGIEGIGRQSFCQWLSEALLCSERTEQGACGKCSACRQVLADAHPDFLTILPEGANAGIKIDSVRDMVDWLQLTAGQDSYRVALLTEANGLNRHAANSLLKTLEEPAAHAVLVLSTARPGALPATVRSRCQSITLKMQDKAAAIDWLSAHCDDPEYALQQANGGPYTALRQLDPQQQATGDLLIKAWSDLFLHKGSVGRIADSLSQLDCTQCLVMFARLSAMAARHGNKVPLAAHPATALVIAETYDRLHREQWFTLYDRLLQLHRSQSASFKTQTVLEGLFADIRMDVNAVGHE